MTVITRRARAFFAAREPHAARVWLRTNSSLWRHFDPMARVVESCLACGERQAYLDPAATGIYETEQSRHHIGFVSIAGVRRDKWCDGDETP